MTTPTTFLGLVTYDNSSDVSTLFQTFRNGIAGTSASSNMNLIDTFAQGFSGSVTTLINMTNYSISSIVVSGSSSLAGNITAGSNISTTGGIHVGGTSDPQADNLVVDGLSTFTGGVRWDGWQPSSGSWVYASATSFTINEDVASIYQKGTLVKFTQTSAKYGVVQSSSYSDPDTTVILKASSRYSIANATIETPYYSYASAPQDFPGFSYKTIYLKAVAEDDLITSGSGKLTFTVPSDLNGGIIVDADASCYVVSSTGSPVIQLYNITDDVDILSTEMKIDEGEYSTYTASIPPVINTDNDDLATGDRIRVDVDTSGSAAQGLDIILIVEV